MARFISKFLHVFWRFSRPMTLGVRAMVWDEKGRIFLVRHTYVPGWYLPGGGVEAGETVEDAVAKELMEEGNIEMIGRPELKGVFFNSAASKRDHVVLYNVSECKQISVPKPNREIAESGFFHLDDLPKDTTASTLRRLSEFQENKPVDTHW